jgi:addiction module HigA family antidote
MAAEEEFPTLPKNRIIPHPGQILLEEFMRPLGLTGNALALALRVPHSRISGVISGSRGVTADTALRLARYFDTSPEFWLYMQAGHDLSKAQAEAASRLPPRFGARLNQRLKEPPTGPRR